MFITPYHLQIAKWPLLNLRTKIYFVKDHRVMKLKDRAKIPYGAKLHGILAPPQALSQDERCKSILNFVFYTLCSEQMKSQ